MLIPDVQLYSPYLDLEKQNKTKNEKPKPMCNIPPYIEI